MHWSYSFFSAQREGALISKKKKKKKVIINYSVYEGVKHKNIVKKKTLCFSSFTLSSEGMSKACLEAQYLTVRNREGEFPTTSLGRTLVVVEKKHIFPEYNHS